MTSEEIVHHVKFSVLLLRAPDGVGTGFAISQEGHVLTCDHVVPGGIIEVVSPQGKMRTAPVLARNRACDLAILRVPDIDAPPVCFADPAAIAEGQTVFALGHPLGLDFTVSRGIVSNASRVIRGISYVQTDTPLNRGNSGGPLVNERGEVVGIADWAVSEAQGIGFAVAVRHALAFAAQLRVTVKRASAFPIAMSETEPQAEPGASEVQDVPDVEVP